jgi:hypothetical protein
MAPRIVPFPVSKVEVESEHLRKQLAVFVRVATTHRNTKPRNAKIIAAIAALEQEIDAIRAQLRRAVTEASLEDGGLGAA